MEQAEKAIDDDAFVRIARMSHAKNPSQEDAARESEARDAIQALRTLNPDKARQYERQIQEINNPTPFDPTH